MGSILHFVDEPNLNLVLVNHLFTAAVVDWVVSERYAIGWWNVAVFVGVFAVLSPLLLVRPLAPLVAVVGTISAATLFGAVGTMLWCAMVKHPTRPAMIAAALPGIPLGVWFGASAYRKVLRRRAGTS